MHALVRTALTSCLLALALPGQITVALHRVDVGPSPIANALPVVDANGAHMVRYSSKEKHCNMTSPL